MNANDEMPGRRAATPAVRLEGLTCADAVDHILQSCPGFYGEVVVTLLSASARVRVDGREAHFLKFEVLEGMHGVAEVFLEEARIRIETEPFLHFVGPSPRPSSSSFRVVRPGKATVRLT